MKVVYDTCLYIDLLRASKRLDLFTDRTHVRYLSPIVVMELRAGAHSKRQRNAVDRLLTLYSKSNRFIQLNANTFYKAGECLSRLGREKLRTHRWLTHDLLIALSALSIGATLFTSDRKDFSLLTSLIPVTVCYV